MPLSFSLKGVMDTVFGGQSVPQDRIWADISATCMGEIGNLKADQCIAKTLYATRRAHGGDLWDVEVVAQILTDEGIRMVSDFKRYGLPPGKVNCLFSYFGHPTESSDPSHYENCGRQFIRPPSATVLAFTGRGWPHYPI